MKLALKIDQLLSEDSAQTLSLVNRRPTEFDTTMNEGGGPGVIKIPPATVDMQVPFGAVANGKFLFIECDFPITFKLNGTEALRAYELTPRATTVGVIRTVDVKGKILMVTNNLTSLYLSNASITDTATVLVEIIGD